MRTAVSAWCVEICSFEWTRGIAKTELQAVQGPEADLPPGVAGSGGASSSSDTAPPAAPGSRDAGGGGVAEAVPDAVPGSRAADGEEPASCDSRTALGPLSVLYEPRRPGTGTVIATGPAGTARWTPRGSHIEYAGPAPLPGFIESGRGTGRVCSGKCTKEKPYPTDVLQISDTISAADADARSQCAHRALTLVFKFMRESRETPDPAPRFRLWDWRMESWRSDPFSEDGLMATLARWAQ
jgi:hypothetical protein